MLPNLRQWVRTQAYVQQDENVKNTPRASGGIQQMVVVVVVGISRKVVARPLAKTARWRGRQLTINTIDFVIAGRGVSVV